MTTATSPPPLHLVRAEGVPDCPYVGLVPFGEQEAPFFFGREREAEMIVANLTAARLTLLYAPSGVGKSSVLRAGVLPQLRQLAEDDADDPDVAQTTAAVAYVSDWSTHPLETAGTAIRQAVADALGVAEAPSSSSSPRLGVDWLRRLLDDTGVAVLYLILDQFEEYFFYHPADTAADGLTAELGDILTARDLNVHVLLSIREDALAGLDRFKGRVPHLFSNYLRLAHLSRDAARAAIEGPLTEYNGRVPDDAAMSMDPQLVDELLDQVRTGHVAVDPDGVPSATADADHSGLIEAPYLQLVLTRIWEQEIVRGSHTLQHATLDELGGAQTIVRSHLTTVVAGLQPEQVKVAAAVFQHLVTASGSKIALTAVDLADWSGQPVSDVEALLESLSAGRRRILRPVPPAAGAVGPPRYEIFHDVMGVAVLEWRRQYVAEERQRETNKQLVAEREQARADAVAARRQLRYTWLSVGLVIVLVLAAGLGWVAFTSWRGQQQQKALAEASAALGRNPQLSLAKAAEAYRDGDTTESRSALLEAASAPQASVVAGPEGTDAALTLIGMKTVSDGDHVVGYDRGGRVVVVGRNGERQAEVSLPSPHGAVVDVAPAPDASRVALATDQGEVAVVDVPSGRRIELATGLTVGSRVEWLGDAATGSVLVVGTTFAAATFSSTTGAVLARFPDLVVAAAGIDSGRRVVTSQLDGRMRVWDALATGSPLKVSDALSAPAQFLAEDGPRIVGVTNRGSAGDPDEVAVWTWNAGPQIVSAQFYPDNGVQRVMVNRTLHTVLIAYGKEVRAFSLPDAQLWEILPKQSDWVDDVATSDDGKWTVTAGGDGQVLVWSEYGSGRPVRPTYELLGDGGSISQAAFLGDGVVALEGNGTMRRWALPRTPRFTEHTNWVLGIDLSGDGHELATAGADGWGYIVDATDVTKEIASFGEGKTEPLQDVSFDPTDDHRVVTLASAGDRPRLWQWAPGKPSTEPVTFTPAMLRDYNSLTRMVVSPDGDTIVAGDTTGGVHFWDSHTGRLLTEHERSGDGYGAWDIAFDPSAHTLAVTVRDGIRLTSEDGTERVLPLPNAAAVAFDPTGQRIAAFADGGAVRVWSTSTFDSVQLVAHSSRLGHLSFSQDGSLLAVGTVDGLVEVWDVRSGVAVALIRHHGDFVNDVLFAPQSNSQLISASDDMTVAEWPCAACADQDKAIDDALAGP